MPESCSGLRPLGERAYAEVVQNLLRWSGPFGGGSMGLVGAVWPTPAPILRPPTGNSQLGTLRPTTSHWQARRTVHREREQLLTCLWNS